MKKFIVRGQHSWVVSNRASEGAHPMPILCVGRKGRGWLHSEQSLSVPVGVGSCFLSHPAFSASPLKKPLKAND